MFQLKDGINECSNAEYHGDKNYLSSSVLKTLYKSVEQYHKEYILGEKPEFKNVDALNEGSYMHTLILEPHLADKDYVIFDGNYKRGSDWEAFKESHSNKTILSRPQEYRCKKLYKAYKNLPEAQDLISGGEAELSIAATIDGVKLKTRYDYINVDKGYIADVKTTSYPGDIESFRAVSNQLMYDLSAALYCNVASHYYGKPFDFYFIVLSKREITCEVYKAGTHFMIEGQKKVNTAIERYKTALATGNWTTAAEFAAKTDYEILEL